VLHGGETQVFASQASFPLDMLAGTVRAAGRG
jgi:hypothetical protein